MSFHPNINRIFYNRLCKLISIFLFISPVINNAQNALVEAVKNIALDDDFKYGSVSICIIDLDKDSIVAAYQPYTSLAPASSLKILTTFAALSILGPGYTFHTDLQYGGEIIDSVLNGNIFIKGGGDPTLGSARFPNVLTMKRLTEQFKREILKLGIKSINGSVVGDGSYFEYMPIPTSWEWDDIGNYYGAGVYGLNFHDNEFSIFFNKSPILNGRPTIEKIVPDIKGVNLINDVLCASPQSGDNCYIYSEPYGLNKYINGTIPSGEGRFQVRGSLPNPPLICADYLVGIFSDSIHKVSNGATDMAGYLKSCSFPLNRNTIYSIQSPMLSEIITQTNYKSVNLYAETLLRELGKRSASESAFEAGKKEVLNFWKGKGLDVQGLFLEDGSGLSPKDGVSSYHFSKALSIAYRDSLHFKYFYTSLPFAGKTGTVRGFLDGTKAVNRVKVKSGSMKRVKSYCGYARAYSEKNYAFAIIINNYNCTGSMVKKKIEDLILVLMLQ